MTTNANAIDLDQLPPGLRNLNLTGAAADAMDIAALIDAASDKIVPLVAVAPQARAALHSAILILRVAQEMAEALDWKLVRMDTLQQEGCR